MGFKAFFKKLLKIGDAVTESAVKDIIPVVGRIDALKDAVKTIIGDTNLANEMRQWPEERLNQWLARVGKAFGPPGIVHFSELSPAAQRNLLDRVPILNTPHTDWIDPWKWVPRKTVCWVGGNPPTRASVIEGHVSEDSVKSDTTLLPIPARGDWYVMSGYMAAQTEDGWHTRLGWRWDDVDGYWDLSAALKKYDYD